MKNKKKVISMLLGMALTVAVLGGIFAAPRFTDVPANHWAAASISKMAQGGLIAGYGNNKFGPNDKFNIDQMATIIARAKGQPTTAQGGYWAYSAVDYCVNELKCLPSQGAISAANYSKVCSRELAYYMLVTGLGKGPDGDAQNAPWVTAASIPDYADIDGAYQDAVVTAYQLGLTVGTDSKMTFAPKANLNRAQAATMFVRAGWTKAATIATEVTTGLTNDELFGKIKEMGVWTEGKDEMGLPILTAKDSKYGGITVVNDGTCLEITMPEWNDSAWGTIGSAGLYDSKTGKMLYSTGFGYDARMLVKQIIQMAYPNAKDAAVAGYKSAFMQEVWQSSNSYPAFFDWIDGRAFLAGYSQASHQFAVSIYELNDKVSYNQFKSTGVTSTKSQYATKTGSWDNATKAYELTKW